MAAGGEAAAVGPAGWLAMVAGQCGADPAGLAKFMRICDDLIDTFPEMNIACDGQVRTPQTRGGAGIHART